MQHPLPSPRAGESAAMTTGFAMRLTMRLALCLTLGAAMALAAPSAFAAEASRPAVESGDAAPWPAEAVTRHSFVSETGRIDFTATAGKIPLRNADTGEQIGDVAYIAFTRDDQDARTRPVAFALNGGPGYASAWLNLGAMGPWLLSMDGPDARPSAPPKLRDNRESWLEFTDLVFLDPAGTGYSRVTGGERARSTLWSVDGDIDSLATAIRRWSEGAGRSVSPKYLVGESYGGFRVPRLAHALQTDQGVGVNGVVLVSPVLDFRLRRHGGILMHVAQLPTYAATARARKGPVARDDLRDVEDYARGDFLRDLARGLHDEAAVGRIVERVAELTGLDRSLVGRFAGRISPHVFAREFYRDEGAIASMYDSLVTGLDPSRYSAWSRSDDQIRLGLHAPIIQAMIDIYRNRLNWFPQDHRYLFQSVEAGRKWDWGKEPPEAASHLARSLGLDPNMRALVVHGLTDLVTPYFDTRMVLDQMAPIGESERIRFEVYPGGHMFYALEASRKAFRDHGRELIAGE